MANKRIDQLNPNLEPLNGNELIPIFDTTNGTTERISVNTLLNNKIDAPANPQNGDALVYNSTTGLWEPGVVGGTSEYTETIVDISSDQILAWNNSSNKVELLPTPTTNKYYDINKIIVEYKHNGTVYAGDFQALIVTYSSREVYLDGGVLKQPYDASFILDLNKFDSLSDADERGYVFPFYPNYTNLSIGVREGLLKTITSGNGTLRVKIYHKTITFGA
jgi:hypothetical protein